jgi:hypothetical protein
LISFHYKILFYAKYDLLGTVACIPLELKIRGLVGVGEGERGVNKLR